MPNALMINELNEIYFEWQTIQSQCIYVTCWGSVHYIQVLGKVLPLEEYMSDSLIPRFSLAHTFHKIIILNSIT